MRFLGDKERRQVVMVRISEEPPKKTELRAVDQELENCLEWFRGANYSSTTKSDGTLFAHPSSVQSQSSFPSDMKTKLVKDASARGLNQAGLNDIRHVGSCVLPD